MSYRRPFGYTSAPRHAAGPSAKTTRRPPTASCGQSSGSNVLATDIFRHSLGVSGRRYFSLLPEIKEAKLGRRVIGARRFAAGAANVAVSNVGEVAVRCAGEVTEPMDEGSATILAPPTSSSRWNSGAPLVIVAATAC